MDIRLKSPDPGNFDAFVLEVNANCGLSFGLNSSSLGEILELSGTDPEAFCADLVYFALARKEGWVCNE